MESIFDVFLGIGLLALPNEILLRVIKYVDGCCRLYSVNRRFRDLSYMARTEFVCSMSLIKDEPDLLLFMPNLKKLSMNGLCFDVDDIGSIAISLSQASLQKLKHVLISNCFYGSQFENLVDALSSHRVSYLQCKNCGKISVDELKYTLLKMPQLKSCDVEIDLHISVDSMNEFAELANDLVGKVNLCCNTLELVPSNMLTWKRHAYRVMFPSGQL